VTLSGLTGVVGCDRNETLALATTTATVAKAVAKANGDKMKEHLAARIMRGFVGYQFDCFKAKAVGANLQITVRVKKDAMVWPRSLFSPLVSPQPDTSFPRFVGWFIVFSKLSKL
jgi:spermidine/putrescine-binding protein